MKKGYNFRVGNKILCQHLDDIEEYYGTIEGFYMESGKFIVAKIKALEDDGGTEIIFDMTEGCWKTYDVKNTIRVQRIDEERILNLCGG